MSQRAPPKKTAASKDAGREGTPTERIDVRFALDEQPPGARGLQALRDLRRQQRLVARGGTAGERAGQTSRAPARAAGLRSRSLAPAAPAAPAEPRGTHGHDEPTAPALPAVEASPLSKKAPKVRAARSPAAAWGDLEKERARAPLEPARYRALAALARSHGDGDRVQVLEEVARALCGAAELDAPAPRLTLRQEDWQSLLRSGSPSAAFDLFAIAGPVLCEAEARPAEEVDIGRPFAMGRNEGSRATGEALLNAVRILGLRAPDVSMSSESSPPLRAVNTEPPRILVGRSAVKDEPFPPARLRFFAGRALASFHPELAAPRLLGAEQLELRLRQLAAAVADRGPVPEAALNLARRVPAKGHGRLDELFKMLARERVSAASLRRSARCSVNRAGLVVAGSAAAAVDALRAKRGGAAELEDLLAFAASERYYQIRFGRPPALAS